MMEQGNTESGDDDVRQLLVLAGPRPQPPTAVKERVRAVVMDAFDDLPAPRKQPRKLSRIAPRWLAVAASVAALAALGFVLSNAGSQQDPAGEILFASGGYTIRGMENTEPLLISPGSIIRTSNQGQLFIALNNGGTLRLDRETSATMHTASEIWLHDGRLYIDADGSRGISVITRNATITDVGTQFEIMASDDELHVAVREGMVEVSLGSNVIHSGAEPGRGELLTISGLQLQALTSVDPTGDHWAWTQTARPKFTVSGHSLHDYLSWVARETGRTLSFDSSAAQQQAGLKDLSATTEKEVDATDETLGYFLRQNKYQLREGEAYELVIGFGSM